MHLGWPQACLQDANNRHLLFITWMPGNLTANQLCFGLITDLFASKRPGSCCQLLAHCNGQDVKQSRTVSDRMQCNNATRQPALTLTQKWKHVNSVSVVHM